MPVYNPTSSKGRISTLIRMNKRCLEWRNGAILNRIGQWILLGRWTLSRDLRRRYTWLSCGSIPGRRNSLCKRSGLAAGVCWLVWGTRGRKWVVRTGWPCKRTAPGEAVDCEGLGGQSWAFILSKGRPWQGFEQKSSVIWLPFYLLFNFIETELTYHKRHPF